jgi:hypothetical protein
MPSSREGLEWRIAAIADIHGNMAALEAVLADIRRRDIFRSPPSPRGMEYATRPGRRFALALRSRV